MASPTLWATLALRKNGKGGSQPVVVDAESDVGDVTLRHVDTDEVLETLRTGAVTWMWMAWTCNRSGFRKRKLLGNSATKDESCEQFYNRYACLRTVEAGEDVRKVGRLEVMLSNGATLSIGMRCDDSKEEANFKAFSGMLVETMGLVVVKEANCQTKSRRNQAATSKALTPANSELPADTTEADRHMLELLGELKQEESQAAAKNRTKKRKKTQRMEAALPRARLPDSAKVESGVSSDESSPRRSRRGSDVMSACTALDVTRQRGQAMALESGASVPPASSDDIASFADTRRTGECDSTLLHDEQAERWPCSASVAAADGTCQGLGITGISDEFGTPVSASDFEGAGTDDRSAIDVDADNLVDVLDHEAAPSACGADCDKFMPISAEDMEFDPKNKVEKSGCLADIDGMDVGIGDLTHGFEDAATLSASTFRLDDDGDVENGDDGDLENEASVSSSNPDADDPADAIKEQSQEDPEKEVSVLASYPPEGTCTADALHGPTVASMDVRDAFDSAARMDACKAQTDISSAYAQKIFTVAVQSDAEFACSSTVEGSDSDAFSGHEISRATESTLWSSEQYFANFSDFNCANFSAPPPGLESGASSWYPISDPLNAASYSTDVSEDVVQSGGNCKGSVVLKNSDMSTLEPMKTWATSMDSEPMKVAPTNSLESLIQTISDDLSSLRSPHCYADLRRSEGAAVTSFVAEIRRTEAQLIKLRLHAQALRSELA